MGGDGTASSTTDDEEMLLRLLHRVLMETEVQEGSMVCGCCGYEYKIHQGVGNFLLPSHLV
jgi:multifunctional methyltransferase subunit TRM112